MPPVREVLGTDGTSLGAVGVEVDGAGPRPCDDTRGLLRDLVMRGTSLGMPRSTTLGDATPAPRSSSAVGPGVARLLLLGSSSFPPLPINWRWVEDNIEFACSQVAIAERLLHEMLASVGRSILLPTQGSLKQNERNVYRCTSGFIRVLSSPLIFALIAPVSRHHKCVRVASEGDSGVGGSRCYRVHSRHGGTYGRDFCPGGYCGKG
jgi:hypothetical protein